MSGDFRILLITFEYVEITAGSDRDLRMEVPLGCAMPQRVPVRLGGHLEREQITPQAGGSGGTHLSLEFLLR